MNITVRTLSGEMLLVALPLASSVHDLQRRIYSTWSDIPLGCLCLHPIPHPQDNEEVELDHEQALLRMGATLVEEEAAPNENRDEFPLEDGMEVFAFVDESKLWVDVRPYGHSFMPSDNPFAGMIEKACYIIAFRRCSDDRFCKPLTRIIVTRNLHGYIADLRTFVPCGRTYGVEWSPNTYKPGPQTIWYRTITDCVKASTIRIPRGEMVIKDIEDKWNEMIMK